MQNPDNLRAYHLAQELEIEVLNALPVTVARVVPGLRNQAIRAVTDLSAAIAEGCARDRPGFVNYLEAAVGSLNELQQRMSFAHRAGVTSIEVNRRIMGRIIVLRRMLLSLRKTVHRRMAEDMNATRPSRHSRNAGKRRADP